MARWVRRVVFSFRFNVVPSYPPEGPLDRALVLDGLRRLRGLPVSRAPRLVQVDAVCVDGRAEVCGGVVLVFGCEIVKLLEAQSVALDPVALIAAFSQRNLDLGPSAGQGVVRCPLLLL